MLNDEVDNAEARRLNEMTYMLSVVPLPFLTGLAGINYSGIPSIGNEHGFWWFSGGCLALGTLQIVLFRRLKWF